MTDCLHFCSTPRNVFFSIGQAWREPELNHHLLLIDQPYGRDMPLAKALEYHLGPFKTVRQFRKGEGLIGKRKVRHQVFAQLDAVLRRRTIAQVFTGNDRRVEFQYVMHRLREQASDTLAIYLEDGVNSYLPFHPSHRGLRAIADPVLEPLLKRLSYGSWYDRSGAVGCSRWVDLRRLTMPTLLQTQTGPKVEELQPTDYTDSPTLEHLRKLSARMLANKQTAAMGTDIGLQQGIHGDLLLLLPHSNDLLAQYGSTQAFRQELEPILSATKSAWVKYHPNETVAVLGDQLPELPRSLPMEMLISQCQFDRIVGTTSAALLSAKWLQPKATVYSVKHQKSDNELLFNLMTNGAIQVVDTFASAL